MKLSPVVDDGVTVVPVDFRSLDAENAEEFQEALMEILTPSALILLDCEGLGFIDSSGLGAILTTMRDVQAEGGQVKLCNLSTGVRALFELVRMDSLMEIYGEREEALASF